MKRYLMKSKNGSINLLLGTYDTRNEASAAMVEIEQIAHKLISTDVFELNKTYDLERRKIFDKYYPNVTVDMPPSKFRPWESWGCPYYKSNAITNAELDKETKEVIGNTLFEFYERNGVFCELPVKEKWVYENVIKPIFHSYGLEAKATESKKRINSKFKLVEIVEYEETPFKDY